MVNFRENKNVNGTEKHETLLFQFAGSRIQTTEMQTIHIRQPDLFLPYVRCVNGADHLAIST